MLITPYSLKDHEDASDKRHINTSGSRKWYLYQAVTPSGEQKLLCMLMRPGFLALPVWQQHIARYHCMMPYPILNWYLIWKKGSRPTVIHQDECNVHALQFILKMLLQRKTMATKHRKPRKFNNKLPLAIKVTAWSWHGPWTLWHC